MNPDVFITLALPLLTFTALACVLMLAGLGHTRPVPDSSSPEYPEGDPQLIYELAKERLSTQLDSVESLDTKIGMLVSLASALLGIAAAVYALRAATKSGAVPPLTHGQIATLVAGTALYLIVAASGLWAYFVRGWEGAPDVNSVWSRQTRHNGVALKWEVANDYIHSCEENASKVRQKVVALRIVFVCVILESLVLATSLYLVATRA